MRRTGFLLLKMPSTLVGEGQGGLMKIWASMVGTQRGGATGFVAHARALFVPICGEISPHGNDGGRKSDIPSIEDHDPRAIVRTEAGWESNSDPTASDQVIMRNPGKQERTNVIMRNPRSCC